MTAAPWPTLMSSDDREELEERAGILEFDAGYPRIAAEALALAYLDSRRKKEQKP